MSGMGHLLMCPLVVSFLCAAASTSNPNTPGPQDAACPRFAYEYQLLERLVQLELRITELTSSLETLTTAQSANTADKQRQTEAIKSIEEQLKLPKPSVAFMAQLSRDLTITSPTPDHVIVFNRVITNVGTAYNSNFGVFSAPYPGTYQFHLTATSPTKPKGEELRLDLVKNAVPVGYVFLDDNDDYWLQRSSSFVLHLSKEDNVFVKISHVKGRPTLAGCCLHSHFSGSLIQVD